MVLKGEVGEGIGKKREIGGNDVNIVQVYKFFKENQDKRRNNSIVGKMKDI